MMNGLGNLGHLGRLGHVSTSGTNHPEVEASGRAFPIWNTKPGDDKLLSLSIHGLTEQSGTPTPENPVPMRSVGDSGLLLSVMPDKAGSDYQMLNIKEAMKKAGHDGILRSVNGIYDEVVYNGKEWKLIQRIQNDRIITCTGVSNHVDKGFCDCYFYPTKAPINGSTPNGLLSTHFVQGNNGVGTINLNNNSPYLGIFRYPTTVNMTKEEITAWLGENEVYVSYQLAEPAEYPLDLPVISTYDNQTYFATNAAEVKPRMVAQCKVSKALDYIREGLIGYYTGRGRSNTDENKNILPDLSGNGNDLENKNFAYTVDSGYGDGYIQYDGVDDYSNVGWTDIAAKSVLLVCEDIVNTKQSPYYSMTSMIGNDRSNFGGISNGKISPQNDYGYFNSSNLGGELYTKDFSLEKGILNIYIGRGGSLVNNPEFVYNLCIGAGNFYGTPTRYGCKIKIHDFLTYNRKLTNEEIEHNYKVSCQYNGEDFSFDHIKQNLIVSYRTYDKTNEDEDRDVLKDLSSNGHDIQLHNFAFSEGSGYGLYATDFTKCAYNEINGGQFSDKNSCKFTINKIIDINKSLLYSYTNRENYFGNGLKVKITGIKEGQSISYINTDDTANDNYKEIIISEDGDYTLPPSIISTTTLTWAGFKSKNYVGECNITIEQIPDYQGALVSDGVDDFGACDNFPVLTKEKGYTVCAIRKWLSIDYTSTSKVFLSKRVYDEGTKWGAFTLEKIVNNNNHIINFGITTNIKGENTLLMQDVFTYMSSKKYNGKDLEIGKETDSSRLNLFAGYTFLQQPNGKAELSNIALYAIEIYNRDLTDEEIAKVKERMIAEYEEKTGNKYEEE